MRTTGTAIGFVGVVVVAFANVPTIWAQSDELPRRLRERINHTRIDKGYPSAESAFDTEKKITASDGAAGDIFGQSVAISGDTAIVGAYFESDFGSAYGAAYVYQKDEGGVDNWGQVTKITASDRAFADLFGFSVAISGDTAIVGVLGDDDHGMNSGAAYVYQRNKDGTDNWGELTKITASDGAAGDQFGYSVAISGDTAIVGAYFDSGFGSGYGSAYVYQRNEGGADNWGQATKITERDGVVDDGFGFSVAISGDTAIVGALWDDDNGINSGAAHVYQRDGGGVDNWGRVAKITAGDGTALDFFGRSLAISGDTAIVGAVVDDDNGPQSGSAYVYRRDEGGLDNWGQVTKVTASDGAAGDQFGFSVAISGDTALVGANFDDDHGENSGAAYVYQRDEGGVDNWGQATKITASDGAAVDHFGNSVAISDDKAIVGAVWDDDNGSKSGSAYVYFDREPVPVPTVAEWGIMAMTLLVPIAMAIKFGRRRRVTRQPNCQV